MNASGDESGEVRHVYQVERANFVCDLPHTRKINDAGIGTAATDDQFRVFFLRKLFQIVVVDGLGLFRDAIGNDLVSLAGKIQMMTVGEMSAMGEVQSENGIAR